MADISIRVARPADLPRLAQLRAALWPESSAEEHARELSILLSTTASSSLPLIHLVAETPDLGIVGFLEAGLRSHADGCDPAHPVGYIEGWYVDEGRRGQGIGRQLIAAAEAWARSHGCTEMASDALIDNIPSQRAHEALGYQVVDRCVHFRKLL
jgi:aminoglycoside 6'-N-acetyltransferase I